MLLLFLSLVALAAGPLFVGRLSTRPGLAAAVDGFVVTAIPLLVLLPLVPHAIEEREALLLVVVALGFAAPFALARLSQAADRGVHGWGLLLGTLGLALHALVDGSALGVANQLGGWGLAPAVILHRLPVGLAIWWLAERNFGRKAAVGALAMLMGATVAGFFAGSSAARLAGWHEWLHLFQAAVAGSLVHVAFHRHPSGNERAEPKFEAVGAVAATVLILFALVPANGGETAAAQGFLTRLLALAAESAPALLIAYLAAGLLSAYLPGASIRWLGGGSAVSQASRGMAVGLPFPICSCGVVPLYRSLVDRGAPPAAAMAFLVATPELGIDAVMLSIPLLGGPVTILRLCTAAAAALLVGWLVGGRLEARREVAVESKAVDSASDSSDRFRTALRTGTGEVVDHTAPWILVGLLVAALVAPWLEGGWLAQLPPVLGVVLFAALGFPTYVCAASATPVVAALLAAGLSPGAGIAFLITGPATNVSTLGVVAGLHGRAAALRFAGTLVVFAISAGILVDAFFPALPVPSLAELTEEAPTVLQWISLAGLTALVLGSVFRRGVRRFWAELREGLGWDHDHSHGSHDHSAHTHA